MPGANERRFSKERKSPRVGTITYLIWHRFVSNVGVEIDVKDLQKELGTTEIHSKIEIIANNYQLNINRCGPRLYILEEI
jgi:hypothetical protein